MRPSWTSSSVWWMSAMLLERGNHVAVVTKERIQYSRLHKRDGWKFVQSKVREESRIIDFTEESLQ